MLLNPTKQFLGLAFGTLEFLIRECGSFLFQLAFNDVKVALDFEFCHKFGDFEVESCGLAQRLTNQ